jgi:tetratricopeptide (TPR) repeat protein
MRLFPQQRWGDWEDVFGRMAAALVEQQAARRPDAQGPAEVVPVTPEAWYQQGLALLRRGRWPEGEHCLRQVLRERPRHWVAYHNLGVALARQRKFDEAVRCFREFLDHAPDSAEGWTNLGQAYRDAGDEPAAQEAFRRSRHRRHPADTPGRPSPQSDERAATTANPTGELRPTSNGAGTRPKAGPVRQQAPTEHEGHLFGPEDAGRPIRVEISTGELIDKITILQIKSARLTDPEQLRHVREELRLLEVARQGVAVSEELTALTDALKAVNEKLWQIEDDIRAHERRGDFGETFIRLARAVYTRNDRRAALKRKLSAATGSRLLEEKSYAGDP